MLLKVITALLSLLALEGPSARAENAVDAAESAAPARVSAAAVATLRKRAETLQSSGDPAGASKALLQLGATYQQTGHLRLAIQTLEKARTAAEESGAATLKLEVEAALAGALPFSQRSREAEPALREALEKAKAQNNPRIAARVGNDLGNLLAARRDYAESTRRLDEAFQAAERAGDKLLAAKAALNAAGVSVARGDDTAAEEIQRATRRFKLVTDSAAKARLFLNAASLLAQTGRLPTVALEAAREGFRLAKSQGDERTAAESLGVVGSLYEKEGRSEEAQRVTREGLLHAQLADAPDTQMRLAWQEGRVLAAAHRRDDALAAYRRAIASADSIRHDLAIGYGNTNRTSSFREAVGPMFFQTADLLLQRADAAKDPAASQAALREARDTLELLKSAELTDYFHDDCVNLLRAKTAGIETVSPAAAIIYLIPLSGRTELLVGLADGWKRFSLSVGDSELERVVRAFRAHLETRTSYEFLVEARQLYDWLVRPLEATLEQHGVDTLVFVPDGATRTIPLAALHDGRRFLIERYAVAVSPGATLTDPRTVERKSAHLLLAGLSQAVQGFSSMKCVPRELDAIRSLEGGTVLLDEKFRSERMAKQFDNDQYSVVHLASHGVFDRDAHNSFILTQDGRLDLDDLERLVRPGQFRGRPVELMTLSACQTAAGDDRAALGMAGVAVKSGARSAVASLWFVNDQSSSDLLTAFYRNLWQEPDRSKAHALQAAQKQMLASYPYRHPCYWAPFLVIGNWL